MKSSRKELDIFPLLNCAYARFHTFFQLIWVCHWVCHWYATGMPLVCHCVALGLGSGARPVPRLPEPIPIWPPTTSTPPVGPPVGRGQPAARPSQLEGVRFVRFEAKLRAGATRGFRQRGEAKLRLPRGDTPQTSVGIGICHRNVCMYIYIYIAGALSSETTLFQVPYMAS